MLIDAHSLLNRAFYGIAGRRRLTAPDGLPTGALYAFLNMVLKYKTDLDPTLIVSAMDLPGDTFRHESYDEYKAGRSPMPEDLSLQIPVAREMLAALGFCPVSLERYEADDLIGTLALHGEEEGMRVYIITGDRDTLQLVSDKTSVILLTTQMTGSISEEINPERMMEDYGVRPDQWVDVKALMGDASDNIPGVKGVGVKTALRLIQDYESLDGVYQHLDRQKGALLKNLEAGKESAYMSQDLSRICHDAPLPGIDELVHANCASSMDEEKLSHLLTRLDFRSFLDRLELNSVNPTKNSEILLQTNIQDLCELDTVDELIQMSEELNTIAFMLPDRGSNGIALTEKGCVKLKYSDAMLDFLKHDGFEFVTWDYKSQLRLADRKAPCRDVFDVMIASYLLNQLGRGDDIEFALRAALDSSYMPPPNDQLPLMRDGWMDQKRIASMLPKTRSKQLELIRERDLERLVEVEMTLVGILADMERKGVLIDADALASASSEMASEISDLEEQIYGAAGHEFNVNSPKQLAEVLYEELNLPTGRKGASGQYSTAADELERLQGYHPVIDAILEHRELSKLRSTFLEGLNKEIAEDGRVHTSYNQTVTSTGRLSSSNPNLQNIPIRTERGSRIRELFIAPPGSVFIGADYSQIELRLLAHLSGDQNLTQAFKEDRDVHLVTASSLFGKQEQDITPHERSIAKTVNFSITYGISDFGLSRDLDISISDAKKMIERYHAKYPQVEAWLQNQGELAKEKGYVETLFHRRRYVPELQSQNRNIFNFGLRAAMNAPVQGTAADLIKIAMVNTCRALEDEGLNAAIILQVHDELIIESAENDADKVEKILQESMESAMELDVPLIAETKRGRTWGELK